ncbi:binding-protein-dependent transport systems inner membrane component [Kribbella flavida DSM 17836]|uniref:Binding-protein-dependent transport systems inner membrane component n=1 Tax=Kribbella flavida (strain DSM 17836 / JCM 10339 / NBRC 14399) TaxID=479435 RepID=D2Q239_KRIFD|nr:carbohydrate ABC transporter permease [Kribbella flavida]ADB33985.1 binding-protein-dependent transport systems inner membrane component [Kribbella flavida DSM 17836]
MSMSSQFDTALGWSPRLGVGKVLRILLCAVVLFVFAAPFLTIFAGAFNKTTDSTQVTLYPQDPTLLGFQIAGEKGIWGYFLNSLVIVGGGLLLQLTVSVLAAYALARRKFRGHTVVMLLFLLTMMLPEEVIAVPLSQVLAELPFLGISLKGSVFGVILPVALWGFTILIMTEFMKEIPREIEEAARLDGVGELRMLWVIVLPLSKPVLGVATIFGFMMIWDQYLLPLIAADDPSDYTLTVALSVLRSDGTVGPGVLLAGALIALVPSLVVYLLMQRSLIRGITAGATKG